MADHIDTTDDSVLHTLRQLARQGWAEEERALPARQSGRRSFAVLAQRMERERTGRTAIAAKDPLGGGAFLGSQTLRMSLFVATTLSVVGVLVLGNFDRPSSSGEMQRTYTTAPGQQATVTLADGSRALLGPATTLTVTKHPTDASVDVGVTGQALFTVAHRHDKPFRVRSGHGVAQVLGTTFMVRHYDADKVARVVVTDGRVSVSGIRSATSTTHGAILVAGMLGTVDDSGKVQVSPRITVEEYTGWTTGQLVFRKTLLRDALVELSRAYDVDIRVTDSSLAAQQLNWTISVTRRSFTDVLELLIDVLDAHPVRTGRVIILMPGRVATRRPVGPSSSYQSERQYGR
jgi:ferric-dicitrate binding protein FerR (iron transport regulator)